MLWSRPGVCINTLNPFPTRSNNTILAASFGPPPTRKAFTEHFGKIRKNSKNLIAGTGTIPSTPSTVTAKKTKTPATKTTATKRKKAVITSASDSEDNGAPPTKTPAKRRKQVAEDEDDEDMEKELADLDVVKVKNEPIDDEDATPSKKPARRVAAAKVTKYEESDAERGHPEDAGDASEDEYVDKEVVEKMSAYLESPDSEDEHQAEVWARDFGKETWGVYKY
jgi:hypothetical protein